MLKLDPSFVIAVTISILLGKWGKQQTETLCQVKEVNLKKNRGVGWNKQSVGEGDVEIGR